MAEQNETETRPAQGGAGRVFFAGDRGTGAAQILGTPYSYILGCLVNLSEAVRVTQ